MLLIMQLFNNCLFVQVLFLSFATSFASPIEGQLINTLLKNYNKLTRPIHSENSPPLLVRVGIALLQIISVDEKRQIFTTNIQLRLGWKDAALHWNPAKYENISTIRIPMLHLWSPDILLHNIADEEIFQSSTHRQSMNVLLGHDGYVLFIPPMIVKTICQMDVTWFPFDSQSCQIKFGSWTYSAGEIDLQLIDGAWGTGSETVDMSTYLPNGEWKLIGINATIVSKSYKGYDYPYLTATFTLKLKRQSMYYFFNLIVPCALIGFLAILGFTLPPDSGEKLSLGVTVLFSLIVFLNMIAESMPSNADAVPLLGTYFNCVMFMIASSVVSTIVVNLNLRSCANGENSPKKIGKVWEKLFLHWLPRLLRMQPLAVAFTQMSNKENGGLQIESGIVSILQIKPGHPKRIGNDGEELLRKKWMFAAVVVDRLCLVISVVFIIVSVFIFLVSNYS